MPKAPKRPRPSEPPRWLRGAWMSSKLAKTVCITVPCPRCRAAKTWPCTTESGKDSATPHAARWEAYHAAQA